MTGAGAWAYFRLLGYVCQPGDVVKQVGRTWELWRRGPQGSYRLAWFEA